MDDGPRLMFLTSREYEDRKAIRGGSLITDGKTRPVEFRCTGPIRPNAYQRTLYGGTLEGYIFVDLIGVPLVNASREQVDFVLVDDERFLAARPLVAVPIVQVVGTRQQGGYATVSFRALESYQGEAGAAGIRLKETSEKLNLLEPFERVQVALEQAHIQKIGDKE